MTRRDRFFAAGPDTARLSYVLPLRWTDDAGLAELTAYLRWLSRRVEVIVVDGSAPLIFARHRAAWRGMVRHLPPDPQLRYANGKVAAVTTGIRLATHEHVVIADDDVRYDEANLLAVDTWLRRVDLVRPQNYFSPHPWHARWDTARSLLNRTFGADYPGTLAIRRSVFVAMGGYDGDVLFENLELIRTVRAYGGTEAHPLGLYVHRIPPDVRRFVQQRVRQAYDDLAQPERLAVFLPLLPAFGVAAMRRRLDVVAAAGVAAIALAEVGRRRASGRRVFPASASLMAPVWLAERAVCVWVALGLRVTRGGVWYCGRRIRLAAHSLRWLRAAQGRARRSDYVMAAP